MKRLTTTLILLFAIILSACSSKSTTKVDFNTETNFSQFSSFQFLPQKNTTLDSNPIMSHRIQSTITNNLISKALTMHDFINTDSADLTVNYHFSQQEKQNNSSFTIGFGTGMVNRKGGANMGISTSAPINSNAIIITTIVIDISHKGVAVWHGSDSYEASGNLPLEEIDNEVTRTITRLLATFPPQKSPPQKVIKKSE